MKKYVIMLLMVCMAMVFLCACGEPKASPVEDFEYEFDEGKVKITGYVGSDLEIVVPSEIEGRPVDYIARDAFENYDLISIVIPEGVTGISEYAFDGCTCLEEISIPTTITSCTLDAFKGTLWHENQPDDSILYIDDILVGYKGTLPADISVKKGTKVILDKALIFEYYNAGSIYIPESVEYIGEEAVGFYENPYYTTEINSYSHPNASFVKYLPLDRFTIHCVSDSAAEEYARNNELTVVTE